MGFVQYQDEATASADGLISVNQDQQAYIGVDFKNTYDNNGPHGRPSIRVETKKTYQYGLFVLDLAHMPSNTCGSWPAFWTTNEQDWPRWGEIDIVENIHENTRSLEALHTAPDCTVSGNQITSQMLGSQSTYNCDSSATTSPYGSQNLGQGCAAENNNPNNFGAPFNDNGGGIYAMEWTKQAINIWHFARGSIPEDLKSGIPNPSEWGQPVFTTAQGSCDIDQHFKDQKVIIDNTFCGNWAGQDALWQQTSCYKSNPTQFPTCISYVAANPAAYQDSYWLVNSLKVYQNAATYSVLTTQLSVLSSVLEPEVSSSASAMEANPIKEASSIAPNSDSIHSSTSNFSNETLSKSKASDDMSSATSPSASLEALPLGSTTAPPLSRTNAALSPFNTIPGTHTLQSHATSALTSASINLPEPSVFSTRSLVPLSGSLGVQATDSRPTTTFEPASGSRRTCVSSSSALVLTFALGIWMLI